MQIGKPSYFKCPVCKTITEFYPGPYYVHIYEFTQWSDGETFKELPEIPSANKYLLHKCSHCNSYLWISSISYNLTFDKIKKSNDAKLFYIRHQILRTYNNYIRKYPSDIFNRYKQTISPEKKEIFITNAKLLIEMYYKIDPTNYLMIAELYRNIGDFDSAINVLEMLPNCLNKHLLLEEIKLKNCDVIKINPRPTTENNKKDDVILDENCYINRDWGKWVNDILMDKFEWNIPIDRIDMIDF